MAVRPACEGGGRSAAGSWPKSALNYSDTGHARPALDNHAQFKILFYPY